ncbi:ribosome silencing factor [Gymnodinialimonas sp. 2305UL16-5]|uniref:ribosome silencing factor n=1 Tax=Gymnodinialimonas mytili TaxID=3126503 RepID=UPI0030B67644
MPGAGAVRRENQEDRVLTGLIHAVAETTAAQAHSAPTQPSYTSEELLERVLKSLSDDKAEDIVQIDLRGQSSIGDYMVIASGRSTRQVAAISEKLVERLKVEFGLICKVEGKDAGDWVLIDTADIIVHVFRPEVREFYQLEKMWQQAGDAST